MMKPWNVLYYESLSGNKPIEEFIYNLETKTQVKIFRTLDLLREFGIQLCGPHTKKVVGTPFWELRIVGSDNIRFFYIANTGKQFIIFHAFTKKTQKTSKKELLTALERLKEYRSR